MVSKWRVILQDAGPEESFRVVYAIRREFGLGLREAVALRDMARRREFIIDEETALRVALCMESSGCKVDLVQVC